MKEHIHTIPVLEALRQPETCPFCAMRRQVDESAVTLIMGPAYMDDKIRMQTNQQGFCAAHTRRMYAAQNRLGLALMTHTYLQRLNKDLSNAAPRALRAGLAAEGASCWLCGMVNDTLGRYMDTFFTLWARDREARALIAAVKGYCFPHFCDMLKAAEEKLPKHKLDDFLNTVTPAQQAYMKQLEADLEWFTLKFDYRNADAPWKNAKDALPRAYALFFGTDGQYDA